MEIYEMLEKGMTIDEIKKEVDKAAAFYEEDQKAQKEEELAIATENLREAILDFLETTGEVDLDILNDTKFAKSIDETIQNFRNEIVLYSKLSKAINSKIKSKESKSAAASDDLKALAKMFF